MSIRIGDSLTLEGVKLDIGLLNAYYNISIQLNNTTTVFCLLLETRDTFVKCQPDIGTYQPDASPKQISVRTLLVHFHIVLLYSNMGVRTLA